MKKFVSRIVQDNDFYKRVNKILENSMTFENLNTSEKYKNEDIKKMKDSLINLMYTRNPIFDKLLIRIIDKSTKVELDDIRKEDWDLNPFLASYELYGTPEFWWLLLLGNRMLSIHEFTKLPNVLFKPDLEDIREQLKNEFTKNDTIGEIIE